MKKYLICLANSKKNNGRCLAGIEIEKGQTSYKVKQNGNSPIWMRPVSDSPEGELDTELVEDIQLMDVVEMDVVEYCPNGFQTENLYFVNDSLRILKNDVQLSTNLLDSLLSPPQDCLFGNTKHRVEPKEAKSLNHSLLFIKPSAWHFSCKGHNKPKLKFTYPSPLNLSFDLPITDISFRNPETVARNIERVEKAKHLYLTISLGNLWNSSHYKLIAGVICCK